MKIALCFESVLPKRGGCETYIASLAHRLVADGHVVHLYAWRWDTAALPSSVIYHPISMPWCPRFFRPWFFSRAVARELQQGSHDVSVGFDKIWGVDVLYPQGGLHVATTQHNLLKYRSPWVRRIVGLGKYFDPANLSYLALERQQYLTSKPPLVVAISEMVYRHFQQYYRLSASNLRLVRLAPNPDRFSEVDRPRRRIESRQRWNLSPEQTVGLFVGLNYRLKGLEPLLHALRLLADQPQFALIVAGHQRTGEFERLAQKLNVADRVRFVGYVPDMRDCYFASDFLVHPTFYDPCSHVVLEAMTCGLPVVTTTNNGAAEMVHPPQDGLVISDPHDHNTLAAALRAYLNPGVRHAAGHAARRSSLNWTFEQHYRQLLTVFQEAANRRRAA